MTAERWRKKPETVEAMRLTTSNGAEVAAWCGGESFDVGMAPGLTHSVAVPRSDGVSVRALPGDYVVRRADGFSPLVAGIFEHTYEPAPAPVGETGEDRRILLAFAGLVREAVDDDGTLELIGEVADALAANDLRAAAARAARTGHGEGSRLARLIVRPGGPTTGRGFMFRAYDAMTAALEAWTRDGDQGWVNAVKPLHAQLSDLGRLPRPPSLAAAPPVGGTGEHVRRGTYQVEPLSEAERKTAIRRAVDRAAERPAPSAGETRDGERCSRCAEPWNPGAGFALGHGSGLLCPACVLPIPAVGDQDVTPADLRAAASPPPVPAGGEGRERALKLIYEALRFRHSSALVSNWERASALLDEVDRVRELPARESAPTGVVCECCGRSPREGEAFAFHDDFYVCPSCVRELPSGCAHKAGRVDGMCRRCLMPVAPDEAPSEGTGR